MADRIYVTYTPTGAPESFHTAIHFERTDHAGNVIQHDVIEAERENRDMSVPAKAVGVIEEALRTDDVPSRFGRVKAIVRNGQAPDAGDYPSSDRNAPYEVVAEGDDLSDHLARMRLYAHGVNRAGFAYRGHRQNSNTFAGWVLRAGELPGPRGVARDPAGPAGERLEFFTPGLNEPWEPPIGPATSDQPNAGRDFNRKLFPASDSGDRLAPPVLEPQKSREPPPVRRLGRKTAGESLNDRFGNWTSTDGGFTPRNPTLPVPPTEPGRPPGVFTGRPMPYWITSPPIFDFPNRSGAFGPGPEHRASSSPGASGDISPMASAAEIPESGIAAGSFRQRKLFGRRPGSARRAGGHRSAEPGPAYSASWWATRTLPEWQALTANNLDSLSSELRQITP